VTGPDPTAPDPNAPDPNAPDWTALARRLAAGLVAAGEVRDPVWQAVLAAVPRHVLVPRFYRQRADGGWDTVQTGEPGYWEGVYGNQTLITALLEARTPAGVQYVPASSSTEPSLMATMLQALDLREGHRVLEIGTGTGYNAALLSHRLGDRQVYSVDLRPELVELARQRLAVAGYRPTLVARDGAQGFAEHAAYDRILATCAVPSIPPPWLAQLAPGGRLMADVQGSLYAGNLVLLRGNGDGTAAGAFCPGWAGFMPIRHSVGAPDLSPPPRVADEPAVRATALGPDLLADPLGAFVAQLHLPAGTVLRALVREEGTVRQLIAPDGSWAEIGEAAGGGGWRVAEAGPRQLWSAVEAGHRWWLRAGQPDWPRFGYVADARGQRVYVDDTSWELTPA
jgi:methyltransferase of ATP-grasp peptide maturase system